MCGGNIFDSCQLAYKDKENFTGHDPLFVYPIFAVLCKNKQESSSHVIGLFFTCVHISYSFTKVQKYANLIDEKQLYFRYGKPVLHSIR